MTVCRLITAGFLAAFLLTGVAQAQESPILTAVKAALKDPATRFTMTVSVQIKAGEEKKFEAAFAKAIKPTRAEKGCLAYELNRDARKPAHFMVYERWQNLAALDAHLKTPHITTLLGEIGDLLAGPPEVRVLIPAGE